MGRGDLGPLTFTNGYILVGFPREGNFDINGSLTLAGKTGVEFDLSNAAEAGGESSSGSRSEAQTPSSAIPVLSPTATSNGASASRRFPSTALEAEIARAMGKSNLRSILRHRGLLIPLSVPVAGTAVIDCYLSLRKKGHKTDKRVLIASGERRFTTAGSGRLDLKLTGPGLALMRRPELIKIITRATFTTVGQPVIDAAVTRTMRR
jgi:hypothetical protein